MRINGRRMNGKAVRLAALALGITAMLGGCTSIRDHRGYMVDQTLVDAIQPGVDNRESVEKTLGRPTFRSEFGDKDWYYVSQLVKTPPFRRPRTVSQLIMRVRFDPKGNVASIDKRGLEDVARISPNGDKTKTLGRDRSLLEDLFGNIGAVGAGGGAGAPAPTSGPNGS